MLGAIDKPTNVAVDYKNTLMQLSVDSNRHKDIQPKAVYRGIVPDVTGMSLKDAVYMLENGGMQVKVQGKGKVMAQSVPAGTRMARGQNIILQLS